MIRKLLLSLDKRSQCHTSSLKICSIVILLCHSSQPASAVLSESCILYQLFCSDHRCTRCAQTQQIKRSTGSCVQRVHNGPSAGCTGARLEESADILFWKDLGNGIMLDRLLQFKLHQSYRPLPRFIREINPTAQEIWSGQPWQCRPRLLWCKTFVCSVRCIEHTRSVLILVSSNWLELFLLL